MIIAYVSAEIANYKLKVGDDQITEMVELYQSGLSLDNIGKQVGVSRETVRKHIAACGIQIRNAYVKMKWWKPNFDITADMNS